MERLTYFCHGDPVEVPKNGLLVSYPRSAPRAGALYRARVEAVMNVETEFFCLVDGGADVLLPGFEESVDRRISELDGSGAHIAYSDELNGEEAVIAGSFDFSAYLKNPARFIHHAPVCRTASAKSINWPNGLFWFEGICYGTLAKLGWVYDPAVVYQWNRSTDGASRWPETSRAVINSMFWLQGIDGVHLPRDFENSTSAT